MMEDKEGVSGLTLLTVRRQLRLARKVYYNSNFVTEFLKRYNDTV